jgi:HEPN domain-containing protein
VLIKQDVKFPYIHDLAELLTLADETGIKIPKSMRMAGELSKFAVFTRYPFESSPIEEEEYRQSVKVAEAVLRWAEEIILGTRRK